MSIVNWDMQETLYIDKYNLDYEWQRQPMLYQQWANKLAEAEKDKDKLKLDLDIEEANLDRKNRRILASDGDKVTEAMVKNAIMQDKNWFKSQQNYLNAKHNVKVIATVVEALNHKRAALENEVKLYLAGYYATPTIPKKAKEDVEEATREKINKK